MMDRVVSVTVPFSAEAMANLKRLAAEGGITPELLLERWIAREMEREMESWGREYAARDHA